MLAVARAVALTSTLTNIEDIKYLLALNCEKRVFNYAPDISYYRKRQGRSPDEIEVLDTFGRAGNLVFEAKRLGLDANEYKILLRISCFLQYSPKYGIKLADDVHKYGKQIVISVGQEIGKFFQRIGKKAFSYLWVWCIR